MTNLKIGKRAPSEYLAEMRGELGPILDQVLKSQRLPAEPGSPLFADDYEGFLSWRIDRLRDSLGGLTGSLLSGTRKASGPWVVLDGQIETVELELRRLVVEALAGDVRSIPGHVAARITERIRSARRKNPAMGNGHYETLQGKLEYCDLRELQDVLTAKATWPTFEGRFGTREILNLRLGQLAELRNGIRHSRAIDEVTRMEGEAALLWFRQLLLP